MSSRDVNANPLSLQNMDFADMNTLWPQVYKALKDKPEFKALVESYYSFFSLEDTEAPVWELYEDDSDEDIKTIMEVPPSSPEDPRWFIYPHACTHINGMFLYLALKMYDMDVDIYESSRHVFLKDEEGRLYDLYHQPLGYDKDGDEMYRGAVKKEPVEFWEEYDMYRFMKEDGVI